MDHSQKIVVYKSFWPATVLLPAKTAWHRCRVYITSQGLAIFTCRADEPHFLSPVDWSATREPHAVRQVGIDLFTAAGLVVVTLTGGCGCGSTLKSWRPSWAGTVQAWPDDAALTVTN